MRQYHEIDTIYFSGPRNTGERGENDQEWHYSWQIGIDKERKKFGDKSQVVSFSPPDLDLAEKFDDSYGVACGKPFTLWTEERVYFPVEYDGSERVSSVPRNPCDEAIDHVLGA